MRKLGFLLLLCFIPTMAHASAFVPDHAYFADRAVLDRLQREAFLYIWEDGDPVSGMVYETSNHWGGPRPVAVGGTGFGISAILPAVDRGWITREQAVFRLHTITQFHRDKSPR